MNSKTLTAIASIGLALTNLSPGYEVWMGMHGTPTQAGLAANVPAWSKTATDTLAKAGIQGINGGKSAVTPVAGTSTENYSSPSNSQFKASIDAITNRDNAIIEFPRDDLGAVGAPVDIPGAVDSKLANATARGYVITRFMLHGSPNANTWTLPLIQSLRAELDSRGSTIKLGLLCANNAPGTQQILQSTAIDFMALELTPDLWNNTGAARLACLRWFWGSPTIPAGSSKPLGSKDVFIQLFAREGTTSYGVATAYQSTRLLIRQIGLEVGPGFLSSSRVILSPTTSGNPAVVPFFPETEPRNGIPDGNYANTKTGITLSLLEQKSFFHAAAGATESRCRSAVRVITP